MCGRYTQTSKLDALVERFELELTAEAEGLQPGYNIAPQQGAAVVPQDSRRRITFMQWGLVPSWARDPTIGSRMINARGETLTEKPAFRGLVRSKRCLVPADGFYEWKRTGGKGPKQPLRFVRKDRRLFGFAGLWDCRHDGDGGELISFTIITTEPNELVKPVHNRMPVILREEDESAWLDPAVGNAEALAGMIGPYPAGDMECYPVSPRMNRPDWNAPGCIEPCTAEPDLFL